MESIDMRLDDVPARLMRRVRVRVRGGDWVVSMVVLFGLRRLAM